MRAVVTFRVGPSRFAVPADVVCEVVELGDLNHRLPGDGGEGVPLACVRDRWLPVVELGRLVGGVPDLEAGDRTQALVVGRGRGLLALPVDGEALLSKPTRASVGGADFVEIDHGLVRVVDLGQVLQNRLAGEAGGQMAERDTVPEAQRVVAFRLGGEEFGIDVMRVSEVLHVPEVRAVPRAPDFVEGVVSVRGSIVPVIDMRKRFSLPQGPGESSRLLITTIGDREVGLVVDSVPAVIPLAPNSISEPPDYFKGLAGRYLEGIAKDESRLIILINVEEILSSQERIDLQDMVEDASGGPG